MNLKKLYELFIQQKQKITTDTRKLEAGSIFFALKGDNFNANTFAQQAINAGCAYAIVDDETMANNTTILFVENVLETLQQLSKYHREQLIIPIIGITGSNGKTTNKELIHAVLSKKYNTYATKGNLNNHIGVPLTLLAITPQHQIAIVEMGANHQGEIAMLCELSNPDYGLITNIGKAHLEGFGGVEGIKKGKSELYKHIALNNGKLFVNTDDAVLMELLPNVEKITYGTQPSNTIYGKLHPNSEYVEFVWNTQNKSLENRPTIKTHLFGHYNFINTIAATCIGSYFEVDDKDINEALANYIPEMNRSQVKKTERNTLILDAYNANPSSMQLAIQHFLQQAFPKKTVILGDMLELVDYSFNEHLAILQQLQTTTNITVIVVGALFYEHKNNFENYHFFKTTNDASEFIIASLIDNNAILIKGSRGIKLEKLVEFL